MMNSFTIRSLEPHHLSEVAELHIEAFPEDIRSRLGAAVVARFFERQLKLRSAVYADGAFENHSGVLLGYCFGGVEDQAIRSYEASDYPLIIRNLVLRPWLLKHINLHKFIARRLGIQSAEAKALDENTPVRENTEARIQMLYYEIFSLAVRQGKQNAGIGKSLMARQEGYALQHVCTAMRLPSPVGNQSTTTFYERIGFRKKRAGDGAWYGQMTKLLKREPQRRKTEALDYSSARRGSSVRQKRANASESSPDEVNPTPPKP